MTAVRRSSALLPQKLHEFKDLLEPFEQVLRNGRCEDPQLFDRLKGFGLAAGEERKAKARDQLYASYFQPAVAAVRRLSNSLGPHPFTTSLAK
jgi:hypothetical protein